MRKRGMGVRSPGTGTGTVVAEYEFFKVGLNGLEAGFALGDGGDTADVSGVRVGELLHGASRSIESPAQAADRMRVDVSGTDVEQVRGGVGSSDTEESDTEESSTIDLMGTVGTAWRFWRLVTPCRPNGHGQIAAR